MGIDVSLTSTGVAHVTADTCTTTVVRTKGKIADPIAVTVERIGFIVEQIDPWLIPGALVVVEGPSYGSTGGKEWDRAGLWHRIVAQAHAKGCPVAVVPPKVRAKWAAGHGGDLFRWLQQANYHNGCAGQLVPRGM